MICYFFKWLFSFLCPIAIKVALQKIINEVEETENDSFDAKLFFGATNLTTNYFEELDAIKLRITVLKKQFSATPEGKLAREMRGLSRKIKDEQALQIFKLPTKLVHEVSRFFPINILELI